jgi:hypothetical protein
VAKTATKSGSKQLTKKATKKRNKVRASEAETEMEAGEEVTIDRRRGGRREEAADEPAGPAMERRQKVNRRRQIDPTTCERDYTDQEVEFMNALDDYKRKSGRMFPTCSEVLEVIQSLGYVKLSNEQKIAMQPNGVELPSAKPMAAEMHVEASFEAVLEGMEQLV